MDTVRLEAADAAYAAGDWATAAREYLASAVGETAGAGYAFHRAGNALMKLKRVADACEVYERALEDPDYSEAAPVACNLGTAHAALGAYDGARSAFERALADPTYQSRYKALQGLAGALYQMGHIEEAAEAYRTAALDETNPDTGKALNNLGLCFMALERPADAVEAYRAAMDIEAYGGRGRAAANLAMAYAALGMHDKAVSTFERARDEFGYEFTASAEAAYRASQAAAGPPVERIEGWSTGEMPPVLPAGSDAPMFAGSDAGIDAESTFFTMTDEEMKEADRVTRRRERRERNAERPSWVPWVSIVAIVLVVAGLLTGAYLFGLGYPTQQMTVNGMMEAYGAGEDVVSYWVAVPATDVNKAMSSLPPVWASYELGAVDRSARTSTVGLTVTLEQGGVVTYEVSLAREGVGWKVNGVANSFSSMDGGV